MTTSRFGFTLPWVALSVAAAIALLVVGGSRREDQEPNSPARVVETLVLGEAAEGVTKPPSSVGTRESVTHSTPISPSVPSSDALALDLHESWATETSAIEGRVLDLNGQPVADVEILQEARQLQRSPRTRVLTRSRADGTFACDISSAGGEISASSDGYVTVRALVAQAKSRRHVIVVARTVEIAGVVENESGSEIGGIFVETEFDDEILSRFPEPLDGTTPTPGPRGYTDSDGRFSIPDAIRAEGVQLRVRLAGYATLNIPQPTVPTSDLRLVLKPDLRPARPTITGHVTRANGEPATRARVFFCGVDVPTDSKGDFALRMPLYFSDQAGLIAVEPDTQAATIARFAQRVASGADGGHPLQLTLGPPALAIHGRVVDSGGAPMGDWRVGLVDGTPADDPASSPRTLEALSSSSHAFQLHEISTTPRGEFEVDGLFDRDYTLRVFDPRTQASWVTAPIRAGTREFEVRIPANLSVARVAGRIVSRDGVPLPGITVGLNPSRDAHGKPTMFASGPTQVTDPDGRFEFALVPRAGVDLELTGSTIVPSRHPVAELNLDAPLTIVANRRCDFRVEGLPVSGEGYALGLLDARGERVPIVQFGGYAPSILASPRPVRSTSTCVLSSGEDAVELVLYGAHESVIGSRPLSLVPDRITLVRW